MKRLLCNLKQESKQQVRIERYNHPVNPEMALLIQEVHDEIGTENVQETIRNLIKVGRSVFKELGRDEFLRIARAQTCKV